MLNRKSLLFLLVFLGTINIILPGQTLVDSLKSQLANTSNDTVYVDILNKLSKAYRYNQPTDAIDYAVKAEKISQNCNYQEGLALAYHNLGVLYADKERNELALEYYKKSVTIQRVFNNQQALAHLYDNMGLIYRRQLKYDLALEYHNQSLSIKQKLHDTIGIAYSYGNIGLIFSEQAKYDKALIHFYNSLRLKEALNDKYGMANSYGNIGVIYLKIKSYDQAQVNLERSLALFKETDNKTGVAESLLYLSDIYSHQDLYLRSIDALNECVNIYKGKGNIKGLADAYLKLGRIFIKKHQGQQAHEYFIHSLNLYQKCDNKSGILESRLELATYYYQKGDFETSKLQLNSLLDLINEPQFNQLKLDALKIMIQIYSYEESFEKTTFLLKKALILSDSLNKQNLEKEVAQVQMQNEFDKKLLQREFEESQQKYQSEQQTKRYNIIRDSLITGISVLLLLLVLIIRKSKKIKKQQRQLQAQQNTIEEQLKTLEIHKQELQHANETKNKFLTLIGHDLRNPFNTINSLVSQLTDDTNQMDPLALNKYLMLIKDAGANAQGLLENLLEWAKNQSGELIAKKEKVSLQYILHGNILLIKELAMRKNIRIIEAYDEINPLVIVDKNMINTVLRNLMSNAIKFNKTAGSVYVETKVKNNEVKILIRDTGIGMTEDKMPSLFDPLSQHALAENLGFSGLGLILCQEFLLKHNQKLYFESQGNEGSSFWFYLDITT